MSRSVRLAFGLFFFAGLGRLVAEPLALDHHGADVVGTTVTVTLTAPSGAPAGFAPTVAHRAARISARWQVAAATGPGQRVQTKTIGDTQSAVTTSWTVAYCDGRTIYMTAGQQNAIPIGSIGSSEMFRDMVISGDGRILVIDVASSAGASTLRYYDLSATPPVALFDMPMGGYVQGGSLTASSDGSRLACVVGTAELKILELALDRRSAAARLVATGSFARCDISPNGRYLGVHEEGYLLRRFDLNGGGAAGEIVNPPGLAAVQIFALTDAGEIGTVLEVPGGEGFAALLRSPTDYVNLSTATPGGSGIYGVNGVSFDGRLALLQAGSQIYIVSIAGNQATLANTIRPPRARDGVAAQMDASGRYVLITAFQGSCATGGYLVDLYVAETLTRTQQSLGQVCTFQLPAIGSSGGLEVSVTDVLRSVEGKNTGPVVVASADQATAAARPSDVQRGKLSLRMLNDAANDIYGNVFHTDDTLTIKFSSTGQATIEVRAAVTARSNVRLAPADADYTIVDSFAIDPSSLSKDLRPASLLRALAASPKEAAALAETAIVQLRLFNKGQPPTATPLAKIRFTPRPNLIRITDRELVGDRPVEPREWRSFVEQRGDLPSGGNLQFLRADRTEPTTITVGVYYSPRAAGGQPDSLASEDFIFGDDIAVPGQPIQFTVEDGIGLMTVGTGGRRDVVRTSRHGLSTTAVQRTLQHIQLTPAESDAMVQEAGRLTAIRAAIVAGRAVPGDTVGLLRDEARVLAFNERDPSAPDEVIPNVNDDLPVSPVRLDALDAQAQQELKRALERRLHILQAGPSYSSYPNSSSVDRLAVATDTFVRGDVMFNLVALPAEVNRKNVHVAFSAEAAAAIERLPAGPGVRIVTADVMARAKSVVESIWGEWGAEVHFYDSPDQLPEIADEATAKRTANVLLISSSNGSEDRVRLLASIANTTVSALVQRDLLDASLNPRPESLPPDSRATTVKGFTFFSERPRYLRSADALQFQPTGSTREGIRINSLVFVEGFRFLQDSVVPYGSSTEIGTFMGNVIAHEFGHHMSFHEPWMFSGYDAIDEQSDHAPYRRNRLAFDLWRKQLNVRGPLAHRRVIAEALGFDASDRQFLKEVFRAP